MGISRSPAIALGIMVQKGYSEMNALEYILTIRPLAQPNLAVLRGIDLLLKTELYEIISKWRIVSKLVNEEGNKAMAPYAEPLLREQFLKKQRRLFKNLSNY